MGKCVVKECNSRSQDVNKADGITFHKIPKDPVRFEKWIKMIRLLRKETDWLPTKTTLICSKHFKNEDKISPQSDSGRCYLSNEAVPILESSSSKAEVLIIADNTDTDEDMKTDEEIEELIETYREHKMRKTIDRLKYISANRLKTIKMLRQRNRRLKLTNKKFKDLIKVLKTSVCSTKGKKSSLKNDKTLEVIS